jgi:hypothetical protein
MQAIHGGKATNDTIDAQKIAVLLRGGMLPQASVYPAAMRATRDLLRRRRPLMRQRAARLTHLPHTNSQDHLPTLGQTSADKTTRPGVAERVPAPAVQKRSEVALAWSAHDDDLLSDLARSSVQMAKPPDATVVSRLRAIPGGGKMLALVLRDDLHALQRCPRVQAFVAYGRRVPWATEAAGTRDGRPGATIGPASLTWAFSEAAVRCRRHHPARQTALARWERTHGQGTALPVFAHQLARAV